MTLGRKQLGDWLPIKLLCRNTSFAEAAPVIAPSYTIYPNDSDSPVTGADTVSMPPIHRDELTGHFRSFHKLDSNFSTGQYRILKEYTIGSSAFAKEDRFEIVAGGHTGGAYVSLFWYSRPHADFLIGQLDDGTIEMRPSPRI